MANSTQLPVLMCHGMLGSAADFVVIGPNNSLAYLLADSGYDVWLMNARGTLYSRKHSTLPLDSKKYWDFSWHEIGYYDLPAIIDYILDVTSYGKLHYVGFSQGTTTYLVLTSARPEYNDKIALMVALAPTVFFKQIRSPLVRFMMPTRFERIMRFFISRNVYGWMPSSRFQRMLRQLLCRPGSYSENFCSELLNVLFGPHPKAYDERAMAVHNGHVPAGGSFYQEIHFVQIARSGRFQQYDFGREENVRRYGSVKPPGYQLERSTAPIALFYGLNDWLVHPRNVDNLVKVLPRVVAVRPVADEQFNHVDFILGINVRALVYDQVIQMIGRYDRS
nr:lipase 1-like [Aedes albopictus]